MAERTKAAAPASPAPARLDDPSGDQSSPAGSTVEAAETGTGTVERSVRLIGAITESRADCGVGELASRLALPVPTIHRLLQLLRAEDVVEWRQNSRRYAAGPELLRLAALVAEGTTKTAIAERHVKELAAITGESAAFSLYNQDGQSMTVTSRATGEHPFQYRIPEGGRAFLVWGAPGKVIMAFLPANSVATALAAETSLSCDGSPRPSPDEMGELLASIRTDGYFISEAERLPGARGIAAPVFVRDGVFGSLGITLPQDRAGDRRTGELARAVAEQARDLSFTLGA